MAHGPAAQAGAAASQHGDRALHALLGAGAFPRPDLEPDRAQSGFGDACLVASQVLAANQGTRFIQITQGGWDMHTNIYAATGLPNMGRLLDDGVSALLGDLQASGLLNETLVVMAGEFGRTVGPL